MKHLLLTVNPGSTSTKIGLFEEERLLWAEKIEHPEAELKSFPRIFDQQAYRARAISAFLERKGVDAAKLSAIVARGGLLRPLASGTYRITPAMLADLQEAARGEHASNLAAPIAVALAAGQEIPCLIVDPVSVDELEPVARLSGFQPLERICLSHALNTKAVAKRYARECRRPYSELRLIVAHLGSGVSLSAHRGGRMVEVVNPREEGPFSMERAGGVPVMAVLKYALEGKFSYKEMEKKLFAEGGVYSYLKTRDLRQVREMIRGGDRQAALVLEAQAYQIAKEIGALATVLEGRLDAILLTGGMAHDRELMADIERRIAFLKVLVKVYPGEDELQALAEGGLRVLRREEEALDY